MKYQKLQVREHKEQMAFSCCVCVLLLVNDDKMKTRHLFFFLSQKFLGI